MFDKKKRVYRFGGKTAEGDGHMRELLGGKGANLAEMSKLGMPVPAGFTITTECCAEYYALGGGKGLLCSQGTVKDIEWKVEDGKLVLRGSLDKRGIFGRSQTWIRK